jgi:hypothetical protein
MTERIAAAALLRRLLETTRDHELDCDQFQELVGPWLDGLVEDAKLRELVEHHRKQCPECSAEVAVLRRALGLDEDG